MVYKAITLSEHIPASLQSDLLEIPGVTDHYDTGASGNKKNLFQFISPIQFGAIPRHKIPEEDQQDSILFLCCSSLNAYQEIASRKSPRAGSLDWIDRHPRRKGLSTVLKRDGAAILRALSQNSPDAELKQIAQSVQHHPDSFSEDQQWHTTMHTKGVIYQLHKKPISTLIWHVKCPTRAETADLVLSPSLAIIEKEAGTFGDTEEFFPSPNLGDTDSYPGLPGELEGEWDVPGETAENWTILPYNTNA